MSGVQKEVGTAAKNSAALVWRWQLDADKPILIDASDNLNAAMKDNKAHYERTYCLSRENVQVTQDDKDKCIRISSKDGTPIPRAFIDQIIASATGRARMSKGILANAKIYIDLPLPDEDSEPQEKDANLLQVELRRAQRTLTMETARLQGDLDRIGKELQRQRGGTATLLSKFHEQASSLKLAQGEVERLQKELEAARQAPVKEQAAKGGVPRVSLWVSTINQINGQITAIFGEGPMTDDDLIKAAGVAEMSESAYIEHGLRVSSPNIDAETINQLLNLVPWEQTEQYKRLSPELKAAQEKLDFMKQTQASGITVPLSVTQELNIPAAEAAVKRFNEEKALYEERSRSAALVTRLKKEHKDAIEFKLLTAPWHDLEPIPIVVMSNGNQIAVRFPESDKAPHVFEEMVMEIVFRTAADEGFVAERNEDELGGVNMVPAERTHVDFDYFANVLTEKLGASGLGMFGLNFETFLVMRYGTLPIAEANKLTAAALRRRPQGPQDGEHDATGEEIHEEVKAMDPSLTDLHTDH